MSALPSLPSLPSTKKGAGEPDGTRKGAPVLGEPDGTRKGAPVLGEDPNPCEGSSPVLGEDPNPCRGCRGQLCLQEAGHTCEESTLDYERVMRDAAAWRDEHGRGGHGRGH